MDAHTIQDPINTYIYICVYIYTYIHVGVYIYVCVFKYLHICIYICLYTFTYVYSGRVVFKGARVALDQVSVSLNFRPHETPRKFQKEGMNDAWIDG